MADSSHHVEIEGVDVRFGAYTALEGIDLAVPAGEFVSIVGPTGCGKSSLLNLVAGLLAPAGGRVLVDGVPVSGVSANAAYMFQHDALLPWKRVLDNVMLGPILRGRSAESAREDARAWLRRVGLDSFEDRYPHQLSGGQRKRAAMAQALINRLPLLLMDEPFGALDVQTRALMGSELLVLWRELAPTVLFVTHDLEEAIALSDRVMLLGSGPRSKVIGDYRVELARPRNTLDVRTLPGFTRLYESIWTALKKEVLRSYEQARHSA